ncbi:hypothetical protein HZ326_25115 [Fusarium oxysporum f. sp. albedinis]|nr:hypothetical protein HZ326_25115 [Fusarium oxysporum f. sp. albedinis]
MAGRDSRRYEPSPCHGKPGAATVPANVQYSPGQQHWWIMNGGIHYLPALSSIKQTISPSLVTFLILF